MTDAVAGTSLHVLLLAGSPLDANPVDVHGALSLLTEALRDVRASAQFTTMIAEPDAVGGLLARCDRPLFSVLHCCPKGPTTTSLWPFPQSPMARCRSRRCPACPSRPLCRRRPAWSAATTTCTRSCNTCTSTALC